MNFRFRAVGTSALAWDVQTPGNCELADSAANVLNNVSFVNGNVAASVAPNITQQPLPTVQVLAGAAATFSVSVANAASLQWQRQSGSSRTNLTNEAGVSGATTATLSLSNVQASLDNSVYRVLVNGSCGTPLTSSTSVLRVVVPVVTTIGSVSGCAGDTVSVPVSVEQLNGVAAISLSMTYDTTKLLCLNMISDLDPSLNTATFLYNWLS